jgi:hypothetical protein
MKIIKFNEDYNPYAYQMYDLWYNILYFGAEYLPWIFLKKVYLDGEMQQLPRWITKKHMDSIDKETQTLINELNWE